MSTTVDLLSRLLDDAAMFPPGNASAAQAITEHLRHRAGPLAPFVGPLLVHIDRWAEFEAAHAAGGHPSLEVSVLGTVTKPAGPAEVTVTGFELPVPSLPLPDAPAAATVACEIRADAAGFAVLAEVGRQGGPTYLGKFRTGGTTAGAFPDEATLAEVVVAAVAAGAPLKFTAGLHHAVRFTDTLTGLRHHGFLNLMVAVHRAISGAEQRRVRAALAEPEPSVLVAELSGWSAAEVARLRRTFKSFGCCGVEDPVRDLVAMGLLDVQMTQTARPSPNREKVR